MTADYRAEHGKRVFGTAVLFLSQGLFWFDSPGGIFTLRQLNMDDAFFRAEIVIGIIVAAYGMLIWRSASRKLSLANCVTVVSCVALVLLGVSKQSEWVYLLHHQKGFLTLNDLKILAIEITIPTCIVVFGGCWADSTYMHERFRRCIPSS